jgi:hypothetical protein
MCHIDTCIENTSTVFIFLYLFHLPSLSHWYPPVNVTYSAFVSFIISLSVHCSIWFCLSIIPVNILDFNQSNPPFVSLPYSFPLLPYYCSAVSLHFVVSCSYTEVKYINIIHYNSFLVFLLSLF